MYANYRSDTKAVVRVHYNLLTDYCRRILYKLLLMRDRQVSSSKNVLNARANVMMRGFGSNLSIYM